MIDARGLAIGIAVLCGPAGAAPGTADEALRASWAVVSIGRDPCRGNAGAADEIVVCGRVTHPYAVPLYGGRVQRDDPGSAAGRIAMMRGADAACHMRDGACLEPLPVITLSFGAGKKSGLKIGKD